MKRKEIIITIVGILLLSTLITVIISKNNKKYVMYDGVMLAMTLDDNKITSIPIGTNYRVDVDCGDTAKGRWLGDGWKLAIEDIKGDVQCDVKFYTRTDNDKLSNIVQSVNPTDNNGYRYSGKNPNNYVWFNNELWRIIGLVPACTTQSGGTCSTRTNLVKIIRNESIGLLTYHANPGQYNSVGKWGSNTLYTLLNSYYYGKQNGTGTSYCYGYQATNVVDCDYTNIGISSDANDYYTKMVKSIYWNIGASTSGAKPSAIYSNESKIVMTALSKIGLMSASDYGYAAIVSGYGTNVSAYSTTAITSTNWLYGRGTEWTNIQASSYSDSALSVSYWGHVSFTSTSTGSAGCGHTYDGGVVRPALYLDSEVYVISGTGTYIDPYIIGM